MIYTFVPEESLFGINREFRKVDLTGVNVPDVIQVVQWDTERNTGVIEYKPTVMDSANARDLEAEAQEYKAAKDNNQDLSKLQPRYKAVQVRRQRRVLDSFEPFELLLPLWQAAAPIEQEPEVPPLTPVEQRVALIEVVRLLRQKGIFTAADIEHLKSTVRS